MYGLYSLADIYTIWQCYRQVIPEEIGCNGKNLHIALPGPISDASRAGITSL